MNRFCKELPDEPNPPPVRWFGSKIFPPPAEDYNLPNEGVSKEIYNKIEGFKEKNFCDLDSDLSDVGEDEPVPLGNTLWLKMCEEHRLKTLAAVNKYEEWKKQNENRHCRDTPQLAHIEKNIFPVLLPALRAALFKADEQQLFNRPRTLFDPVDLIAELMWNMNPKYPDRAKNYQTFFNIPPFVEWLQKHPRPDYPRHYFWNKDQCACCIQRNYRGYLVRRRDDVQQLRQFWKVVKGEARDLAGKTDAIKCNDQADGSIPLQETEESE